MRAANAARSTMPHHRRPIRLLLGIAACAVTASSGCARFVTTVEDVGSWGWHPDRSVVHTDTSFLSDGRRITLERFAPHDAHAGHPAVLVLHTSAGPRGPSGAMIRRWADALAHRGYVAFVVHYFDRTGDTRTDDAQEDAAFPVWSAALSDAVTFVEHDPVVHGARVNALGVSLGGYMALALGASDKRVSRLVVLSGGLFNALADSVHRLPPTLLVHGAEDAIVPVAEARRAYDVMTRLHVPGELVVYKDAGHGFDPVERPEVLAQAVAFLDAAHR